ncbi:Uncharacterized protein TCM_011981 [Theobroma cacao]|uniref:Uncharacterized protein n=1 Tax=Theobroma cacao TaxID=3641 RepID=A0A061FTD0_THECC|nr:Uncharacterized protein TCM_011981 [Theobroma cacao]
MFILYLFIILLKGSPQFIMDWDVTDKQFINKFLTGQHWSPPEFTFSTVGRYISFSKAISCSICIRNLSINLRTTSFCENQKEVSDLQSCQVRKSSPSIQNNKPNILRKLKLHIKYNSPLSTSKVLSLLSTNSQVVH